MKISPLFPIVAASFLIHAAASGQDTERLKEQAVDAAAKTKDVALDAAAVIGQKAREAWTRTKAYISDDPQTYSRGADQRLKDLGAEIATLRAEASKYGERAYFLARVDALERHLKYATDRFAALPAEELRKGREGLRKGVDAVLSRLEEYVDLAQKEVADFRADTTAVK